MLRRHSPFILILFVPLIALGQHGGRDASIIALEDQLDRPLVELFEVDAEYPQEDLRHLRGNLDRWRHREIELRRKIENDSERALESSRSELRQINRLSSRDTAAASVRREALHSQIRELERAIETARTEREQVIPASFEIKLAKLTLIESWPRRQKQIARAIQEGRARIRAHGDIEDIGYRKLGGDPREDVAAGQQTVREMKSSGWMPDAVDDRDVQVYVGRLADRLAQNSDLKIALHVEAINSGEIRAISVPGGFVFLTSGLILASGSEAELACVMSREIARIAARHGVREQQSSLISKILAPAAQVAAGFLTGGITSRGASFGIGYGVQGLGALVDRTFAGDRGKYKKEADQLGIQYAWKGGFDPRGLVRYVDTMVQLHEEKRYRETAGFFPTDSSLGRRLLDAFAEIKYLPAQEGYSADSEDFWRMKARLD